MPRESTFQSRLIKRLKREFPGCIVLKTDPNFIQGFPDLLVLFGSRWAALECKRSASASHRPNQEFYIARLHSMSYSSFVYPENEEQVFHDLQQAFGLAGAACVPVREQVSLDSVQS